MKRTTSGMGEEVTELEGLFGDMREVRDDLAAMQNTDRDAVREAQRRKEVTGDALVQRSLARGANCDSGTEPIEVIDDFRRRNQQKATVSPEGPHQSELTMISSCSSRLRDELHRARAPAFRFREASFRTGS